MSKKYVFSYVPDMEVSRHNPNFNQAALLGACQSVMVAGMDPYLKSKYTQDNSENLTKLQDMFLTPNDQIDIDNLYPALVNAQLLDPSDPKFYLVSKDLVPGNRFNYVLGFAMKETGFALQSTHRFKSLSGGLGSLAVRHIAAHEMGHMLGLDENTIKKVDQSNGHCANECTMKQVSSSVEAAQMATNLRNSRLGGFCIACASTLREINA